VLIRALVVLAGLLVLWQIVVWVSGVPVFILPGPWRVATTLVSDIDLVARHAIVTITEILAGLGLGTALGVFTALAMARFAPLRRWMLPVMVVSQAVPVFAIAPLLVLWLGYGMSSKVAMAVLIIYFPVTATLELMP